MTRKSLIVLWISFIFITSGVCFGADVKKGIPAPSPLKPNVKPPVQAMTQDIAIDDIYVDTHCRVWVRWKNKGNVTINKVLKEKVFVEGTSLQSDSANHVILKPGAVFAHGVGADPGMILSGSSTVTASIDTENSLTEKDEKNNSVTKTLSCGKALPDLNTTYNNCKTLRTSVDSQNRICKIFEVSVTIKNFGTKDITTPFKVSLERDSGANRSFESMGMYDVPGLAAGAERLLDSTRQADTCFWYIKNPDLRNFSPRIRVTVDSGKTVFESIETNNQTIFSCNLY